MFRAGGVCWDRHTGKLKGLAQSPRGAEDSEPEPRNWGARGGVSLLEEEALREVVGGGVFSGQRGRMGRAEALE